MIPYGHRIKITKKIKEINKLKDTNFTINSVKNISNNNKPKITISINQKSKPKTNIQYDELPMNDESFLNDQKYYINDNIQREKDDSYVSKISKISKKSSKSRKELNENINEENKKRLFHQAVVDFVNENRPKFDDSGKEIKYLKEEYGFEPKNKYIRKENSISTGTKMDFNNIKNNDINNEINIDNVNNLEEDENAYKIVEKKTKEFEKIEQIENKIEETLKILHESISDFSKLTENKNKNNDENFKDIYKEINNDDKIETEDPSKTFLPYKEKKETCYNCFKVHLLSKAIIYNEKKFCKKECFSLFRLENIVIFILIIFID